jgi:hypothetical protein
MSVPYTIAITKDILNQSKHCGADNDVDKVGNNCAIAVALQDIFPRVYVNSFYIFPFGIDNDAVKELKIPLPLVARQFIKLFDGFSFSPRLRLMLPEFEFTIDVTDDIVNAINIDEVKALLFGKRPAIVGTVVLQE